MAVLACNSATLKIEHSRKAEESSAVTLAISSPLKKYTFYMPYLAAPRLSSSAHALEQIP